jgi:hypothetical protein
MPAFIFSLLARRSLSVEMSSGSPGFAAQVRQAAKLVVSD